MALTKRDVKGSPLTNQEMDNNLQGLADGSNFETQMKKSQCKAWATFDGTTAIVTIKDSFNVSDIVRLSVGTYQVYFQTPMNNINYSWTGKNAYGNRAFVGTNDVNSLHYEDSFIVHSMGETAGRIDSKSISVIVFGGIE